MPTKDYKALFLWFYLKYHRFCSPIIFPLESDFLFSTPFIPKDFCLLPPELGNAGAVKLLEECSTLDRFQTIPLPAQYNQKLGTHPIVCCPEMLPNSSICFKKLTYLNFLGATFLLLFPLSLHVLSVYKNSN